MLLLVFSKVHTRYTKKPYTLYQVYTDVLLRCIYRYIPIPGTYHRHIPANYSRHMWCVAAAAAAVGVAAPAAPTAAACRVGCLGTPL